MTMTDIAIPSASQAARRVADLVAGRRVREALAVANQVVTTRRCSAAVFARLQVKRASLLFTMGRAPEAVVVAKALCRTTTAPDDVIAEAEVIQLLGLLEQENLTDSRVLAEKMLGGGARRSTDDGLAGALAAFGAIAWEDGRVADALTFLQSSVERSDCGPLERRRVHPRLMLARLLIALGEHDGARSLVEQARVEIDAGALTEWSAAPAACLARLHFAAGRLDAAEKEARAATALANELGTGFVVPLARATLASVALARDRTAAAARAVASCRSVPAPT